MNEFDKRFGDCGRLLAIDKVPQPVEPGWPELCREAFDHAFNGLLLPPGFPMFAEEGAVYELAGGDELVGLLNPALLAAEASKYGLQVYADVELRELLSASGWTDFFIRGVNNGLAGFLIREPGRFAPADWARLVASVRGVRTDTRFLLWTPGSTPAQLMELRGAGFDGTFLSLPWWDERSPWLADEYARLDAVASVIVPVDANDAGEMLDANLPDFEQYMGRRLWTAAIAGNGVLVPQFVLHSRVSDEVKAVNQWLARRRSIKQPLVVLNGLLGPGTVVFRGGDGIVLNPDRLREATLDWRLVQSRLPTDSAVIDQAVSDNVDSLLPQAYCRFSVKALPFIKLKAISTAEKRRLGLGVMNAARIAIEAVRPQVEDGRFAVKTVVGTTLEITANIFMDGHERLGASVLWRAADESDWREVLMTHEGNDRWSASITLVRVGRHQFHIKAWHDRWESYRAAVIKKRDAGMDVAVDIEEGRLMLGDAVRIARRIHPGITSMLEGLIESGDGDLLLADSTAQAMRTIGFRAFETRCQHDYPIMAERRAAVFSTWYELFPRSESSVPGRHGTFVEVRRRLAAIKEMGFDVLYFPPIHPIGRTNRKGRNNSLTAGKDDVGSPYAIGSEDGGHDAVHPQLGTLDDFRQLLHATKEHGLEVALDFAIQCSPDHPWLKQHPNWFNWRPDGTLRYAENPPKRYEDIVNPEFYQDFELKPRASLWRALRDVVLFWIEQGVRIFRVDNPHTKPLPFWEWMLGEIHSRHPDVIFLSEAFTRPAMMYRLGKVGFSQSYTYFTWRNNKAELTSYLEELATAQVANFFRPNFFVNTPDINPYFLQNSGRSGFLIRAALAATLSGSWGMYSGFELCEAAALPGREEYLDSEKYELRQRNWSQSANIIPEITQLNRVRKSTPALWTHMGVRFHPAHDDHVLFFSKSTPQKDSVVLVGICLDPHASRRAWLDFPFWSWGLPDHATVHMEDALSGREFDLQGNSHQVEFTPESPYFIWRVRGLE